MIRDKVLKYLYESGFVQFYTKKLLYREDINDLYEDYLQEVWLQICEIPEKKWEEITRNNTNPDQMYGVRNFVSVVIRNTVISTTSSAYRKLKKQNTVAKQMTDGEWQYLSNVVPDTMTIF